ncbi:MAG: tripartite tricarboxylate transporter substrate binding protein [Betaproteobacteria bacterium]|nr:tripartite tricarboxylate transporter substrate binding protein [Betaproteobacteria bacterium]
MNARALFLLVSLVARNAWAEYPEKPVKIIVPFAAGSGTDVVARATGAALAKRMNVSVTVENMPSADGAVGTLAVAKSAPDGYTLLFTSNALTIAPYLSKKPTYDPVKDFVAVAQVATIPLVLVTGEKSRFKTFDDVIAEMRQNPGKVRYATAGGGTLSHLEVALMTRYFKVQAQDQAYKSAEEALAATIGGKADVFLANLPSALATLNKGALRALAVSSTNRVPRMSSVPTLGEAMKRPAYESNVWFGLVAPSRTYFEILTRLEDEIGIELQQPNVSARIEAVGGNVAFLRSAPFGGQIGYEYRKWGQVAGAQAQ